jgi:hypothetical protein
MGLRIAKVNDEFFAARLRHVALKLLNDAGTRLLVRPEDGIEVVWVQRPGQRAIGH